MASIAGFGTLLECPYNKAHRVQATAMARHLFKCRKMYPDTKLMTCPFNHAHKVAEPELKMHAATCEDRANFDVYKYCIATAAATQGAGAREPELIYNTEDPVGPEKVQDNDDECWDDLRIPAYNPQEYCANAKIIRKATLKTPAEKRSFYEQETKRLRDIDIKIKQEEGNSDDDKRLSPPPGGWSPPRRRSPPNPVQRRSRSRSRSPARHRTRRPFSRSPPPGRSRRSRSNSRKSRSFSPPLGGSRKRERSRSLERPPVRRRSPSPDYRRNRFSPPERFPRFERQTRPEYGSYNRVDYRYGGSGFAGPSRYDPYARMPRYDYGHQPAPSYSANRFERWPSQRDQHHNDDDEFIYRRDFRD